MMRPLVGLQVIALLAASCSSIAGPTLSEPSTTTLVGASTSTAVPVSIAEATPLVPAPYADAAELAADISAIELAILAPETADFGALGHRQQRVYRQLSYNEAWHAEVLAAVDPSVRVSVELQLDARLQFLGMQSRFATKMPDWTIIEPEPADALLSYYQAAEEATGIEWEYLAAINLVETGMGRISGVSSANAQGPMQFLPTTWEEQGIGAGDITDPNDAIQAAARYLVRRGGPEDMQKALWGYNNHDNYVAAVMNYAELIRTDVSAYYSLHAWEIYFLTNSGDLWLPVGYSEVDRIPVTEWIAANPGIITPDDGSLNHVLGGKRPADATEGPANCDDVWSFALLYVGVPGGCIRVTVGAELSITNRTGGPWVLDLPSGPIEVPDDPNNGFQETDLVVGDLFQVGFHELESDSDGPDVTNIWVVDPATSRFANEEITLRSFAELRPGDSIDVIETALGSDLVLNDEISAGCFDGSADENDPYAPNLIFFSDSGARADAELIRIDVFDRSVTTPSGISIGSTEAELYDTYGDSLESYPHEYQGPNDTYVHFEPQSDDDADHRLAFEVVAGEVISMWTATLDGAYLVEGCA